MGTELEDPAAASAAEAVEGGRGAALAISIYGGAARVDFDLATLSDMLKTQKCINTTIPASVQAAGGI